MSQENSVATLLKTGVHFGHRSCYWNPKMAPYIHSVRGGVHIIDIEKTQRMMSNALSFIEKVSGHGGVIVFVGTKMAAQEVIREEALRAGMPYVDRRWLGGMLTNFKTIKKSVRRQKDLQEIVRDKKDQFYTKKERLNIRRQLLKLEVSIGGISAMNSLPDALFVVDVKQERIAILEAKKVGIPVIGIVDTNACPDLIDYVIPGNDDAIRAIRFYAASVADAIIKGQGGAKKKVEEQKSVVAKNKQDDEKPAAAAAKKPEAEKPAAAAAKKPEAEKPAAAAKKPAAKKPAAAAKKPAAKKPAAAAKKPAAKKPAAAAKKPAAKKPAVTKVSKPAKKDA
jgi:small subunit ribosomal protein S2